MCPYWIGRSTLSYWLCACAALLSCALFAADCELQIDELYQTSWTLKDALPGNIQSLAQTADGYLWLGTASGLFGFDGIDSSDFCPGKASRSRATRFIRCWRYPTAGYGWGATAGAEGLYRFDGTRWQSVQAEWNLGTEAWGARPDDAGRQWIGRRKPAEESNSGAALARELK
jgi:hypothetical protein